MPARGIFDHERFVTSEAVELELPAASVPIRMASGLIDLAVVAAGVLILVVLLPSDLFGLDAALTQAFTIVVLVIVMAGLPITLETLTHGRTVGKLVLGLRTVRDDTGPIGLRHATIRALVGTMELWLTLGSVALLVSVTNERAKRLGDYLAGTYVIRDRVRLRLPQAPQADPALQSWAQGADIGVIPDGLVIATRQFLSRSSTLTPGARQQVGSELYGSLLGYVSPEPPQAHPERVMATLLAERRRRDEQRLERADALRARTLPAEP